MNRPERPTIGQWIDEIVRGDRLRTAVIGAVLLASALLAGAMLPPPRTARGELNAAPPPPAFQSGGQMSVPILKDISTTLHQIDNRLARMEALFNKLATTPSK
jgi:hypothetical protein